LLLATPGREALFLNSLKIAKRKISNNALCWLAKKKMFSQKKKGTRTRTLYSSELALNLEHFSLWASVFPKRIRIAIRLLIATFWESISRTFGSDSK